MVVSTPLAFFTSVVTFPVLPSVVVWGITTFAVNRRSRCAYDISVLIFNRGGADANGIFHFRCDVPIGVGGRPGIATFAVRLVVSFRCAYIPFIRDRERD